MVCIEYSADGVSDPVSQWVLVNGHTDTARPGHRVPSSLIPSWDRALWFYLGYIFIMCMIVRGLSAKVNLPDESWMFICIMVPIILVYIQYTYTIVRYNVQHTPIRIRYGDTMAMCMISSFTAGRLKLHTLSSILSGEV